jgi:hypothetical protein
MKNCSDLTIPFIAKRFNKKNTRNEKMTVLMIRAKRNPTGYGPVGV